MLTLTLRRSERVVEAVKNELGQQLAENRHLRLELDTLQATQVEARLRFQELEQEHELARHYHMRVALDCPPNLFPDGAIGQPSASSRASSVKPPNRGHRTHT
jgi:regulator of replication initiation timing